MCGSDSHPQVWDLVEEYDTGCTSGGGADGLGVFYDAGVLFESNTIPGTKYRPGDTTLFQRLLVFTRPTSLNPFKCYLVWSLDQAEAGREKVFPHC